MKLLILADDFTGAMDTGVKLSKAQIKTLVLAKVPDTRTKTGLPPCEVLVLNTNLRHESPKTAYETISHLLRTYYEPGLSVYMKTDSALRGNISATLAAAVSTLRRPLHFIPAFPDVNRTTRNAAIYIEDIPLGQSVFRNDPRSPMTESSLVKIVTKDYPLSCRVIPTASEGGVAYDVDAPEDFNGSAAYDADMAEDCAGFFEVPAPQLYLYDCSTNEELAAIASYLKEENSLILTAGCAGFAAQFPNCLDFSKEEPYIPDAPGPILFFSGSANAITFHQLAKAKEAGYPLFLIRDYVEAVIKGDALAKTLEDTLVHDTVSLIKEGKSVILATALDKDSLFDLSALAAAIGSEEAVHQIISDCSARLTKRILEETDISALTVFGGDTVAGILEELGCFLVEAKGEVDTGVPICLLSYKALKENSPRTLHLITKSGGLGPEEIVKSIDKYFNDNYTILKRKG